MNKRAGRTELRAKHIAVAVAAAFGPSFAYGQTPPPNQLPNLTVTQGLGQVNAPVGNFLQVDQFSQRAIFSGSMSIGSAGHMNVSQPGSSAIGLFKDVSGSLTQIFGRITANGQVFISNQNGVLFGSTARVEVGGLFASSLSINDNDFMEGRYNWYNDGATGTVTNQGTIITPSGYTVLAGPQVRNDGIIVARTGSVVLAAGDRVSLDLIGDGLISVSVDQAALNASAVNTGTIEAEGGKVVLTARSANALLDTVVNAGGVIRANSLVERNGEIVLDGGGAGMVAVSGRHEAGSGTVSGAAITINGTITTGPGAGSQTITTPGALTIEAGTAGDAGLFHNGSGEQRVAAGSLVMRGGTGTDSRAIITSGDAAADQSIAVAGDLTMTGGSAGTRNLAIIRAFGDQTVAAGNLTMAVGAGGADNAAVIVAPRQTITTTGDARLSGGGSFGNAAARIGGLSIASAGANTPTDLQLNVGNDLVLTGGPGPNNAAIIGSTAGQPQDIRIQAGRDVVLGATGNSIARIGTGAAPTPGYITVTAGRDVQVNGSGEILSGGIIAVTAGRAVNVSATSTAAFTARISSTTGQTIDAQSVTVTAQNSRLAQIVNTTVGEQRITTTGNVEIQTLGPGGGTAEIRNGAGLQTLSVGGEQLTLRGMGSGMANIASSGDQTINMTSSGPKAITIGDHAAQGTSTISSGGDQKILGYADITVTGGSGPVANSSNASILATNPTRTQRIEARNLSLANSILGGNNSFAGIQGASQSIHALGNVTLTANASGGTLPGVRIGGLSGAGATATNLVLTVGGDLVLTASNTTANNGVGIGSTAAPGPAFANNISIDAGRNVILNGGTTEGSGARIGSSGTTGAAPGDISISADGAIVLNGGTQAGAIRTQGNVTLEAASISEGTNGLIVANTLTTTTTGATSLTGANDIVRFNGTSGDALTLVDAGSLQVSGISTTNDTITLTTDSLTNSGVISNGGGSSTANVVLNADAFNLAGGTIEGGAAAVVLRPRTGTNSFGIEAAGATTLSNADIASIQTDNFIIFGSSTGTIFTGNMTIGENARVEGNGKNLAFSRSLTPGAEMITIGSQGVATTGDVILGAGGGGIRSNGGTVTGDEVVLRATNGIGTPTARVKTAANALALNQAGGGGVFVSELDNVTLRTISLNAGGPLTVSNINNGSVSLISGGDVNVAGLVSSGGSMILDAGGNLNLDGTAVDAVLVSNGGQAVTARSINMTAANGRRANIENVNGNQTVTATAGGISLQVAGGFGVAQIVNTSNLFPGDQTVSAAGQIDVLGGAVSPVGSRNSGIFKNGPGGLQTVSAAGITLQGASTGTSAGALISSQGDQLVDVTGGTINLRGGNGGTANSATIGAAATGQQTIRAHHINLSNGFGGTDTIAGIVGGRQRINATGSVTLTAQGSLVSSGAPTGPGVRIGAPSGSTTGTDLTLLVGGDLVLNGGTAANNGASIGSSGAGVAQQNTIVIDAGGSVILNSGSAAETGARIGSSSQNGLAGGNISIQAGGAIELNGTGSETAIRTLGNVTLDAASVSESSNGFVLANTLNVITDGAANLAGPNDVARFNASTGGSLMFVDAGGLRVTGVSTTNDTITLTTDSLVNEGMITNGGSTSTANIVLNADAFNLAGGTVEGGAAAVILRPRTGTNSFGIESAGQTTLTNADIGSIHTSDFVVFGSGMGTTFTGNMTIGQNARVEGGDKNLAFFRSSVPGGTTTIGANGVSTTGNVIVSAGGGAIVSEGGTVSGDQVQLRASQGIGSQFMRVQTAASRLALNNTGPQGAFVFENGDVTLGNINLTVGGIANNVANVIGGGGSYDVLAAGSITVSDLIQAGSVVLGTSSGSITEAGAGAIVANDLRTFSGQSTILGGDNQVSMFNASAGGDVLLANTGDLSVDSMAGTDVTITNRGAMTIGGFWSSAADTSVTTTGAGSDLTVTGFVNSGGAMDLNVGGALRVTAGTLQNATLQSSGGQNITAASVEVISHDGGFASLTNLAGDQTIGATAGGIEVQSSGASGFAILSNNGGAQSLQATGGAIGLRTAGNSSAQISNFGAGDQRIAVSGAGLEIEHTSGGTGFATLVNAGAASQHIGVSGPRGIDVTTVGGGSAGIANAAPATQTIEVSGGSGIRLQSDGGNVAISSSGGGQVIRVTDAHHIKVNGAGGSAFISANGGTQTVSITGSGANAITLGSAGGLGFSQIGGGSTQNVTAGDEGQSGSIIIIGTALNGLGSNIVSRTGNGTQTVSTSGLLGITGGTAPSQTNSAGIFHSGSGEQTVNAARIELQGGAAGNNNAAQIVSSGGGVPANAGAQTVNVSGDLVIAGGAGGNAGLVGPAARLQRVRANNIYMTNSAAGGINSVGFVNGGHQDIHARGDLTMTARASGGDLPGVRIGGLAGNLATATDLKLTVDGDIVLNGSTTTANNGVGIGSTAAPGPAFANDITIDVGGDLILNSGSLAGTGSRIGSSAATGAGAGDIRITAGGDIRLNGVEQGTAIRTLGNVTLEAASIVEASRGIIEANALTASTSGDTLLNGRNQVSSFTASSDHGNVALTNTSAVLSLGSMDLPGNLAIVQTGDVTVGSATATSATLISAAGDISMSASGQILVRGSDTTFGAGSMVLADGELGFSAGDVTLLAGNAALTPVVVRGAEGVEMTVGNELRVTGGRGLLSPALLTSGGDVNLTLGSAVRVDGGSGLLSLARVQTETKDGVIRLVFPNLSRGGYFVNGIERRTHDDDSGFYSVLKPAKVGKTLRLEYGD